MGKLFVLLGHFLLIGFIVLIFVRYDTRINDVEKDILNTIVGGILASIGNLSLKIFKVKNKKRRRRNASKKRKMDSKSD